MRTRVRLIAAAGLLGAILLLSSGCLFNIFQTARTIGAGNVALTIGTGLLSLGVNQTQSLALTPQARLTIGVANGVDLGIQTGLMVSLEGGEPGWLGAIGDLKFSLFDEPDAFALALGFGGGYSVEALGWAVLGEVFFDSNVRYLPIFLAYQPQLALGAGAGALWHHLTAGIKLAVSDRARILMQVDYRTDPTGVLGLLGYGIAIEVVF